LPYKTFFINQFIYSILLLIIAFQPINAETLAESREQAKAHYFSGQLEKALSSFQNISKSGDAESQYYIGLIYLTDNWPGKDIPKAVSYLTSAADQSNTDAMWKLGELHENGIGVKKDLLIAIDWYRKSKDSETLKPNVKFLSLNNQQALIKSNTDVIEEIRLNALNDNVEAQFKLAKIFDEGKLTEQDKEKAFYWYNKAANNNHSYSMLITGYMYCRGTGVEVNQVKANEWLLKSGIESHCH